MELLNYSRRSFLWDQNPSRYFWAIENSISAFDAWSEISNVSGAPVAIDLIGYIWRLFNRVQVKRRVRLDAAEMEEYLRKQKEKEILEAAAKAKEMEL